MKAAKTNSQVLSNPWKGNILKHRFDATLKVLATGSRVFLGPDQKQFSLIGLGLFQPLTSKAFIFSDFYDPVQKR